MQLVEAPDGYTKQMEFNEDTDLTDTRLFLKGRTIHIPRVIYSPATGSDVRYGESLCGIEQRFWTESFQEIQEGDPIRLACKSCVKSGNRVVDFDLDEFIGNQIRGEE